MKSEDSRFEDAFDAIMRWYRDDVKYPLTPLLLDRLNRWKSAREYMLTMRPLTDSLTVSFLQQTHRVSEPQGWRDVRDTKRFFASMERTNKEFDRIMLVASIRDLRAKAEQKGQFKVAASCDATLAKMGVGDDSTDEDQNTGRKIELLVGFNPKLVGAKEIPNLLQIVERFIGEQAKRELMIEEVDFDEINGKR